MSSYYFIGQSFAGPITGTTADYTGVFGTTAVGSVSAPSIYIRAKTNGFYSPAASQVAVTTASTQAMLWDASQNTTIPAASAFFWNGATKLLASSNGILQVQPFAGGNGSANATGILFGVADSTGAQLVRSGNGAVKVTDGAAGNASISASGFFLTASDQSCQIGLSTGASGLGMNGSQLNLYANNINAVQVMSAGQAAFSGNATANGSNVIIQSLRTVTTTNGGAATANVGAIPAGALVLGVVARVTTTITGPGASFSVGDGTTANLWGAGIALAAGTTVSSTAWKDKTGILTYNASENVVITANSGTFTGGVIETFIFYISATAPTS